MGQKVNPRIFRISVNRNWNSKWFSSKQFVPQLRQDVLIRKYLKTRLKDAGVSKIEIERSAENLNVIIYAIKPGVIIGRSGAGIEELKKEVVTKFLNKQKTKVEGKIKFNINIMEVEKPHLNAQVMLDLIISDLEKRIPYRRSMKQAISKIERAGSRGVKVTVAGRLNGAEIARVETLTKGNLPLHTLRADIDYSRGAAQTIYGKIGVKVWIYKGEIFNKNEKDTTETENKKNDFKKNK